ncbi:MAG: isopentenyl-diphosphate delta-isomerase [Flaviaesturariibacter sp.]|nr:isopentenyl-diphosphate delta-isomerase [Flaviaesturariibacter sp.]
MKRDEVILVTEGDVATGTLEKMEAHRQGLLHRAFSVFIFDPQGRLLLQQRAATKYHGGLLWTNSCCSHPFPGEETAAAATRRLQEELGFTTQLTQIFDFTYRAEVENGLTEHEFDHVFAGRYHGAVNADPSEVAAVRYASLPELEGALKTDPAAFTTWFRIVFPRVRDWWNKQEWETVKMQER